MRLRCAAVALLIVSCAPGAAVDAPPEVLLDEFSVVAKGAFEQGANVITVRNHGEFAHTVVFVGTEGDFLESSPLVAPGEDLTFEVDLPAGSYEISCRIVVGLDDGTLVDHYQEGMVLSLSVGP